MVKRRNLETLLKMQEDKEKIIFLLKHGFSTEAIAMSLNITQASVRYWLRLDEVKQFRNKILQERLDEELISISQRLKDLKNIKNNKIKND